ncbi:NAD(P)-dependent oxidoreductase [Paraburkholderia oxyphila]|uniref:NAD(P)-dependent oxidoreductase n=1 Tax=Paraburkholderia oxyphila TaxID=614212 RepID=UPI000486A3FD|nr:NAD(P)-dependent oxidoreductase [Paraburkholderia oxyphila]
MKTVGMIGLGQIGLPVATNLIEVGARVLGVARTGAQAFAKIGGIALDDPAAVLREADVVLLCLPSEAAQLEVLEGDRGLLKAGVRGKTIVELGTYSLAFKLDIQKRLNHAGLDVLECEVSGSPPLVLQKKAALFIGGSQDIYARCKPVLDLIAPAQFHLGPFGAALNMKLIANALLAVHTLAAAEAMNLGARAGFDPSVVVDAIRHSAGASTMFNIRAPLMAARQFEPAPGPFTTLDKYLQLASELATVSGSAMPLFSIAASYFRRAMQQGIGEQDIAAVITLLEEESGEPVRHPS